MEAIEVREKAADKKKAAATMLVFMLVAYPATVRFCLGKVFEQAPHRCRGVAARGHG